MSAKMAAALTPIYVLHSALPSSSDYQEPGLARSRHRLPPSPNPPSRCSRTPEAEPMSAIRHLGSLQKSRLSCINAILMTSPAAPSGLEGTWARCAPLSSPPSPARGD